MQSLAAETDYWLRATGTPALAVALLADGKTQDVFSFGSTDPTGATPITEATIFQAASLSKQALLYAVLQTIDAGRLDLDRPLIDYMETPPDYPEANLTHITARHVLTHSTGWPNWPPDNEPLKPVRELGQWSYSGAGFVYLQNTLESIWHESASDYTRRLVLDPLGMDSSSFVWRDAYAQTATAGFDQDGNAVKQFYPSTANGASSLLTTAREYALLLEAYLAPGIQQRHPAVYTRHTDIDTRVGWSLGWGTADNTLWQWGHNNGFKAFSAIIPSQGRGIVVLSNGAGSQRVNREWVNTWLDINLPAFFLKNIEL
jgi:CubicO group peptidase (beta-lactamase class C family)